MSSSNPIASTASGNGNGKPPCGAVLVCGGGVAGIQASLDLSAAGFRVYLVEESPTIGGGMARLDKTFPTGDCATCIISPKLVECMRDLNVEVMTMADVVKLDGEAGNFRAQLLQRPRSVDEEKCTGCGDCWNACPVHNVPETTPPPSPGGDLDVDDAVWLQKALKRHGDYGLLQEGPHQEGAPLIPILQDLNDDRGYLPRAILEHLSVKLEIPLAEILRVASFYNAFSLEPVGRHLIEVCLGTACFVRGSGLLLEQLMQATGVEEGGTDEDLRFTLRTVRCIGCCALAPAMRIDGVTFGKVKLDKVPQILEQFE